MASNARNLSKLLGTSTQVPTTALPTAIADLEPIGTSLSGGDIAPKNISSNTLTQSFDSNQTVNFNMSDSIDTISPIVSVFKEVPQPGVSSKGNWDVNANATNYDFFDEKPISYSSVNLTPSATGDGTFTSSNPVVVEFDVTNMAYNNKSYDFASQSTLPEGGGWGNNGTVFFMCTNGFSRMYSYTASTAYDISTLTYDNKYLAISSPYSDPCDVIISADGTKFWGTGRSDVIVGEFTMSTAFDLSTASYNNSSLDMSAQLDGNGRSISFGDNGTKLYATGYGASNVNSKVVQYNLSTAYDLSTATYSGNSIDLTSTYPGVTTAKINADGTKMLIAAYRQDEVHLFTLSTAYDLSTATDSGISYNFSSTVNTTSNSTCGGTTNPDGSEFYYFGGYTTDGNAYQFNMGGSSAFNAADVGKKVVGNSGSAIITATSGTYKSVTAFADTSAISSWQLFGAEGKSDGTGIQLAGYVNNYDLANASYTTISPILSQSEGYSYMHFKPDGTKVWVGGQQQDTIYEYDLSTAFDLSTISYGRAKAFSTSTQSRGFFMKSDGTRAYISNYTGTIYQLDLSTAWDISTATYNSVTMALGHYTQGFYIKSDGTKLYNINQSGEIKEFTLNTPWDISNTTLNNTVTLPVGVSNTTDIFFSNDGTKFFVTQYTNNRGVSVYSLGTAWDTSSTITFITNYATTEVGTYIPSSVGFNSDGSKMYVMNGENTSTSPGRRILEYATGSISHPYSQYFPALTNSSTGQINSSSWQDINSMTADETKNDGDIFYAVSTDNRTSWGVAKGSDGVRKIVKNNSGTWQYNNDAGVTVGYDIANGSYVNSGSGHSTIGTIFKISSDGNYWFASLGNNYIYKRAFGTAYDVTTLQSTNIQDHDRGAAFEQWVFSDDGTVALGWHNASATYGETFYSTGFDLTTATASTRGYNTAGFAGTVLGNGTNVRGFAVKPGTYNTIFLLIGRVLHKVEFTGGSFLTGTKTIDSTTLSLDPTNQKSHYGIVFKPDGSALYAHNVTDDIIEEWTLNSGTTAWDLGNYTKSSNTLSVQAGCNDLAIGDNGTKLYVRHNSNVYQYSIGGLGFSTNETWVNGTNNNEHATLQQALGAQTLNRMDKAQLDAVADGYHFSQDSADTLDLMIAPYAASGISPISDGVTINYDAEAIVREAVAGTDYVAEFPSPTRLDIKSLINGNLKIRAQ